MPSSGVKTCALRSEEHTSELQSLTNIVCRLLLEKKIKFDFFNVLVFFWYSNITFNSLKCFSSSSFSVVRDHSSDYSFDHLISSFMMYCFFCSKTSQSSQNCIFSVNNFYTHCVKTSISFAFGFFLISSRIVVASHLAFNNFS